MPNHYEWKQGALVAIADPTDEWGVKDGPHTENLFSHGLPFTIYPRPSLNRKFAYQFVCSLVVAQPEYFIWVSDFPSLTTLLSTLQVTSSAPDLPEVVRQAERILNGFALLPVNIVKDSSAD